MNRLVRALFFIVVIFIVSGYGQSIKKRATIDVDMVRHHLREYREEYGIPGAAAVVVTSKSFLSIATDGVRKLGEPDSIQFGDRFHIGSNTKAMTGFAAGALVEKGLIKWDTRILEIFPEFTESCMVCIKIKH